MAEGIAAFRDSRPTSLSPTSSCPTVTASRSCEQARTTSDVVGLVVLTMHAGDDQIFAAMEAGASAFVGKDSKAAEVVSAASHAAVAPRTFLCTGLSAAMMRRATAPAPPTLAREEEVLALLADGLGTAEIAGSLYMSESTAKTHITHIYQKLGAANRAQALVSAMRHGPPRPPEPGAVLSVLRTNQCFARHRWESARGVRTPVR